MSNTRGIVVKRTSDSARPIKVNSTLPIALVVTSDIQEGLYYFDSPTAALKHTKIKAHKTGNMLKYLKLGVDQFPVNVPTIISVANKGADKAKTKTNIIKAVNALKRCSQSQNKAHDKTSMIGLKPDIIGVCDYAIGDSDVANALATVCSALKARSFVDLNAADNGDAISKRNAFGSDRITPIKTSLLNWNTDTNTQDEYDASVALAWLRAYVDGGNEEEGISPGWSKSISNRIIPFSGVKNPSDFIPGSQDDTDPLSQKQITSFIVYKGLRVWNYKTCSSDAIWQDARRVRIFDLAAEAVLDGIFYAVDKDLSALSSAKRSLRGFMNGLVGQEVMIGFTVKLDEELTTKEAITDNKFYFKIDAQESPSPELICVTFNRVDRFAPLIIEKIKKA